MENPDQGKNHRHSSQQTFTMNEEYKAKQITELSTFWKKDSSLREYHKQYESHNENTWNN